MKHILTFCLLILFSFQILAQQGESIITYKIGKPFSSLAERPISEYLGKYKDGHLFAAIDKDRKSAKLFYVSLEYEMIKTTTLKLNTSALTMIDVADSKDCLRILNVGEKILMVIQETINKENKVKVYCRTIDRETLSFTKEEKPMAEHIGDSNNSAQYQIVKSNDNKYMALVGIIKISKKEQGKFDIIGYDSSLQSIWTQKFSLPFISKLYVNYSYKIDANGNFYLFGKSYNATKDDIVDGKANYDFHIFQYNRKQDKLNHVTVDFPEKFITDMELLPVNDSIALCSGLYSEKKVFSNKGVTFFTIDFKKCKSVNQKIKEFNPGFISTMKTINVEEKQGELWGYTITDLVPKPNGGYLMVAERQYTDTPRDKSLAGRISSDGPMFISEPTVGFDVSIVMGDIAGGVNVHVPVHFYRNLIVTNINPDFSIDWITYIPKYESSKIPFSKQYELVIYNDNAYFIFNQQPKKIKDYMIDGKMIDESKGETLPKEKYSNIEDKYVLAVMVDKDGNRYSTKLWKCGYGNEGGEWIPVFVLYKNPDNIILTCRSASKALFSQLMFK